MRAPFLLLSQFGRAMRFHPAVEIFGTHEASIARTTWFSSASPEAIIEAGPGAGTRSRSPWTPNRRIRARIDP